MYTSVMVIFTLYTTAQNAVVRSRDVNLFNTETKIDFDPQQADGFRHTKNRAIRAATARKGRIWDHGVIPYEIDDNYSGTYKALFKQAMRHWENFTCIKFVEREAHHENFIIFKERPCGCCSLVGKNGIGGQVISIGKNCNRFGIVVHELGHVVGFWHEHTRPDRDEYVKIIRENIMAGQEYNFRKLEQEEVHSMGLQYDFNSIMHYARNTYSKGKYLDTIQPVEAPGRTAPEIGQRLHLSEGDIAQTNLLYNCPKCGRTYQDTSASFSAPVYTNRVAEEGVRCEWRITATQGEKIVLNITNLDIQKSPDCRTDFLEVRDGYWSKSPVLGLFCGAANFYSVVSQGNRMLVTYVAKNPQGHKGFDAKYEAICGGDLFINTTGHLESPNYPEDYQSNKECVWRIRVPDNHQVALRFQDFDMEYHEGCAYDYVEVKDGLTLQSPLMRTYCGHILPADVVSSSNVLLLKFFSDESVQRGGFSATVLAEYDECSKTEHGCAHQCVNMLGGYACTCRIGFELHVDGKNCVDTCGGVYDSPNGVITSPSFPDSYPPNKTCVWEIVTSTTYRVILNFTQFDLEGNMYGQQYYCEYDRVDVFSKKEEGALKKHGSYCGGKAPGLVTSDGNVMRVEFYSDSNVEKRGFAAQYLTDEDECATNNGGCQHHCVDTIGSYTCTCRNGYILKENGRDCQRGPCTYEIAAPHGSLSSPNYPMNYPAKKDCVWHLKTTPGHRVRVSFQQFELEEHPECHNDYLDFHDGPSLDSPWLGRFCGKDLPHMILSSSNHLYLAFKSDNSVQSKGFWATHSAVCGGTLQATLEKQYIYSHSKFGKTGYENEVFCDWGIEAPVGYSVRLSFLTFNVEFDEDCRFDYVEVFKGSYTSGFSYGRYCGSMKPFEIASGSDAILIRFETDDTLVSKGFSLVYEAVEDET